MKIMLCCSDGMSTSLLVEKMKATAASMGVEAEIWAIGLSLLPSYRENAPDVIMVGPQIKYKLKTIQNDFKDTSCIVEPIDMLDYGMMNGEKVFKTALKLMENKHE